MVKVEGRAALNRNTHTCNSFHLLSIFVHCIVPVRPFEMLNDIRSRNVPGPGCKQCCLVCFSLMLNCTAEEVLLPEEARNHKNLLQWLLAGMGTFKHLFFESSENIVLRLLGNGNPLEKVKGPAKNGCDVLIRISEVSRCLGFHESSRDGYSWDVDLPRKPLLSTEMVAGKGQTLVDERGCHENLLFVSMWIHHVLEDIKSASAF